MLFRSDPLALRAFREKSALLALRDLQVLIKFLLLQVPSQLEPAIEHLQLTKILAIVPTLLDKSPEQFLMLTMP